MCTVNYICCYPSLFFSLLKAFCNMKTFIIFSLFWKSLKSHGPWGTQNWGWSPFRSENMLLKHPSFKANSSSWWNVKVPGKWEDYRFTIFVLLFLERLLWTWSFVFPCRLLQANLQMCQVSLWERNKLQLSEEQVLADRFSSDELVSCEII